MTARRITPEELERLAWDHGALIEVFMDAEYVVVGGREFVADLPAVAS